MFYKILIISIGASIGALLRYLFTIKIKTIDINNYIYFLPSIKLSGGTLFVNILGSLGMGIFLAINHKYKINNELTIFITTGFLGGFTTFSSFTGELLETLLNFNYLSLTIIISLHIIFCLIFCYLGYKFTEIIM